MIRKAAKNAVGIAIGTMVGGCILPRIIFRDLYNDTWPPLWKEAILYFATGYVAAFSVLLLIYRIKEALHKGKAPSHRDARPERTGDRAIFGSVLPGNIDWKQVGEFLGTTQFYKQLLSDHWRESDAFTAHPVSQTSMDCIGCLHEDLASCYQGTFAFDENGQEDRHEEYRLLRERLYAKYGEIDGDILEKIYLHYLQEDCW